MAHGSTCSTSCVVAATRPKAATGRSEWIPLPRGLISTRRERPVRRRPCPTQGALPNYKSSDQDHDQEALGRSRGGLTTKVHLAADLRCRPVARVVTPGQRNDAVVFNAVMDRIRIHRRGLGRPRTLPGRVLADKAYSSRAIRASLRRRGIAATIPEPADQQANRARRGPRGDCPRMRCTSRDQRTGLGRTIGPVAWSAWGTTLRSSAAWSFVKGCDRDGRRARAIHPPANC